MDTQSFFSSPEELGSAVKNARKNAKLTQAELAFAAGVGVRFIGELEGGKTTHSLAKSCRCSPHLAEILP